MTRAFVNGQKRARSKTQQLLHILKMAGGLLKGQRPRTGRGKSNCAGAARPGPLAALLAPPPPLAPPGYPPAPPLGRRGHGVVRDWGLRWLPRLASGVALRRLHHPGTAARPVRRADPARPSGAPAARASVATPLPRARGPGRPTGARLLPARPSRHEVVEATLPQRLGRGSVRTPAAPRRGSRSLQRRRSPSARRWGIFRGVRGRPGASRGALAPSQCLPCRWRRFSTERASVAQGAVSPRGPRAAHTGTRFALCSLWWAGLISNKMSPFIRNHFNSH